MNIILLGPPGAGKGTQAKRLEAERNMIQLSTGDMLREARSSGSEMGNKIAKIIDGGELVTDEIVINLIEEKLLAKPDGGFIFDGFPRTLGQADALTELMDRLDQTVEAVIELQVDDDALVARITARTGCSNCGELYNDLMRPIPADGKCETCGGTDFKRRADDNEDSLRTRLMEYYKKTAPLIGYYHAKGLLRGVDGLGGIDEVAAEIKAHLD